MADNHVDRLSEFKLMYRGMEAIFSEGMGDLPGIIWIEAGYRKSAGKLIGIVLKLSTTKFPDDMLEGGETPEENSAPKTYFLGIGPHGKHSIMHEAGELEEVPLLPKLRYKIISGENSLMIQVFRDADGQELASLSVGSQTVVRDLQDAERGEIHICSDAPGLEWTMTTVI